MSGRAVFGDRLPRIPLRASKPSFGHTLGAAGAVEAVATIFILEHQYIPPTPGAGEIDPALGPLDLAPVGRPAEVRWAMTNSFGFGVPNASLVLRRAGEVEW